MGGVVFGGGGNPFIKGMNKLLSDLNTAAVSWRKRVLAAFRPSFLRIGFANGELKFSAAWTSIFPTKS